MAVLENKFGNSEKLEPKITSPLFFKLTEKIFVVATEFRGAKRLSFKIETSYQVMLVEKARVNDKT